MKYLILCLLFAGCISETSQKTSDSFPLSFTGTYIHYPYFRATPEEYPCKVIVSESDSVLKAKIYYDTDSISIFSRMYAQDSHGRKISDSIYRVSFNGFDKATYVTGHFSVSKSEVTFYGQLYTYESNDTMVVRR